MLFDAHARAFEAFGGVPQRGIYENMKTAVDQVLAGKKCKINARFEAMTGHYLFEPEFCNVASGWEKGIVEKNVRDRRTSFGTAPKTGGGPIGQNSTRGWQSKARPHGLSSITRSTLR
jgi:transposase